MVTKTISILSKIGVKRYMYISHALIADDSKNSRFLSKYRKLLPAEFGPATQTKACQ